MADQENRVSPGLLATSNLVTPAAPIVEPRAVAALAEAFRGGQLNANDVIDRAGELAQKRKKAELQLLDEAGGPQAAEARALAQQAAVEKNRLGIAQSQAAQPMVPQTAELAQGQLDYQLAIQKYPAAEFFTKYAPAMGLETPMTGDGKPDYAKMAQVGAQLATWVTDKSRAEEELKNIDTHVSADGTQLIPITKQGTPVPVSHVKELQDKLKRPFQFMEPGAVIAAKTPVAPVSAVAPNRPTQTLFGADAQRAADFAENQSVSAAPVVTTKTAAPMSSKPEIAPVGTQLGDTGFSLGSPKARDMQDKPPTEAQQRAQLALARFSQSGDMLKSLADAGYDPTTTTSWIDGMLPEILKSGNRKTYDAAVDAWSQGTLRLESGAAISRQEKSWYEKSFFPQVGDPPSVVESKAALRHDVEKMTAEIAQAGSVLSPQSVEQTRRIYAQADAFAKGKSTTPTINSGGQSPVYTLSSGKKVQRGADGQFYQVP